MGKPIIDDELWKLIEPLLPPAKPRRFKYPGHKPVPNRAVLTGILFVLKTCIRWRDLPAKMGCGSCVSCWLLPRDWQEAAVRDAFHALLLTKLLRIPVDPRFPRGRAFALRINTRLYGRNMFQLLQHCMPLLIRSWTPIRPRSFRVPTPLPQRVAS